MTSHFCAFVLFDYSRDMNNADGCPSAQISLTDVWWCSWSKKYHVAH